jgi:hypothetical protein
MIFARAHAHGRDHSDGVRKRCAFGCEPQRHALTKIDMCQIVIIRAMGIEKMQSLFDPETRTESMKYRFIWRGLTAATRSFALRPGVDQGYLHWNKERVPVSAQRNNCKMNPAADVDAGVCGSRPSFSLQPRRHNV